VSDVWIYGDPSETSGETARTLAELGFIPRHVAANGTLRPTGEDGAAVRRPELALVVGDPSVCARLHEDDELGDVPIVVVVESDRLGDRLCVDYGHELILRPFAAEELAARIARARRRAAGVEDGDVVRVGTLEVNLATYQVAIDGVPVDFAYMEYELLKFLVTHPNRVFSREALLSRVWGYDYYGCARTVDVHVRRVRAKLGQEHASRIKTVRSVGYRFEHRGARG
jgi:DNA-binding response OmpR family regulator